MGNKTIIRIVLSAAVIIGFFLPWFTFIDSASGWDVAMTGNDAPTGGAKIIAYSFLLIPLFAALVLIVCLQKKVPGTLLRIAPFLVITILAILFVIGAGESSEMQGVLSLISYGFYVSFAASLLLVFAKGSDAAA